MDEDFLSQFRLRPHPARADALYRRLSQSPPTPRWEPALRRASLAVSTLVAGLLLVGLLSPSGRYVFADFVRVIGGMTFREAAVTPAPPGRVTHVPFGQMTLEEAIARLPFTWGIPAWAPDGYVLQSEVSVVDFSVLEPASEPAAVAVHLTWQGHGDQPAITLSVMHPAPAEFRVRPEAVEEVTINGQPAALVRGGTDPDGRWIESGLLTLMWQDQAGVSYRLATFEGAVRGEELMRMAESIP